MYWGNKLADVKPENKKLMNILGTLRKENMIMGNISDILSLPWLSETKPVGLKG